MWSEVCVGMVGRTIVYGWLYHCVWLVVSLCMVGRTTQWLVVSLCMVGRTIVYGWLYHCVEQNVSVCIGGHKCVWIMSECIVMCE